MSGNTSIVASSAGFVPGVSFSATDARNVVNTNALPGLFSSSDFTVTQRAAGANMSVDIGRGRAIIDPQIVTQQGVYVVRQTAATYNTNSNGLYTWTAADPTNARIDLICLEVKDTDQDGSGLTGWRYRIVDGTPNASLQALTGTEKHQLAVTYWPAVPTGCVPIAAVLIPNAATTITTANITNLCPVGGGRTASLVSAGPDSTSSATYARLPNTDFVCVYVPAGGRATVYYEGLCKVNVASGTQNVAFFINGNQLRLRPHTGGATVLSEGSSTSMSTFLGAVVTSNNNSGVSQPIIGAGATSDVTDVATGMITKNPAVNDTTTPLEVIGLPAGWYIFEVKWKTSANTITAQSRRMQVEVIG